LSAGRYLSVARAPGIRTEDREVLEKRMQSLPLPQRHNTPHPCIDTIKTTIGLTYMVDSALHIFGSLVAFTLMRIRAIIAVQLSGLSTEGFQAHLQLSWIVLRSSLAMKRY
jgi:hypothetical protein